MIEVFAVAFEGCERNPRWVAAPGVTVIVGSELETALPPMAEVIVVAVPAASPVKIAEYVPFPLSVTEPIDPVLVPPELPKATRQSATRYQIAVHVFGGQCDRVRGA